MKLKESGVHITDECYGMYLSEKKLSEKPIKCNAICEVKIP